MFVLMISRSSSKQGQKVGHLAKSAENCLHSRGHIFEIIIINIAQNVYLDDF